MTRNHFASSKAYVIVLLMFGMVWSYMPFSNTVHGQTERQKLETQNRSGSDVTRQETVIFRPSDSTTTGDGLYSTDGGGSSEAKGGNGGGKGGGRGKKNDPTPTPTPSPEPTPTSTPTPEPTPDAGSLATQWQVVSRPGVKLFVDHSGWYKVTSNELASNGFDTGSSSYYWQLYRDGVEVPMQVNSDGSIEFFGAGIESQYTRYAVYYLIQGDGPGLRPEVAPDNGASSTAVDSDLYKVVEKPRSVYIPMALNGGAEKWFGPIVGPSSYSSVPINLENTNFTQSNASVKVEFSLQGYTNTPHTVQVKFNAMDLGTVSIGNLEEGTFQFDVPVTELVQGQNFFHFMGVGSSWDLTLVDTVSVTYPRKLNANRSKIRFGVSAGDSARVGGFADYNFSVYEVSGNRARRKMEVMDEQVNGTAGFSLSAENRDREFMAVANSEKESVAGIKANNPSSWYSTSNSADLLIVAPSRFAGYAAELAARRSAQGFSTYVVDVEDIADEFGFGLPTPGALRAFFGHAAYGWSGGPGYVVIFGDSSFDYKNYLSSSNHRNFVPTKLLEVLDRETSSDGWLVDFNNDGVEDLSIGRLPVGNDAEAVNMLSKIARYEAGTSGNSQFAALIADTYFEILNQDLQNLLPQSVSSAKIEMSELGAPLMAQEIALNASADPTMVSYLGHGTISNWTNSNVFNRSAAANLSNQKLSFYMLMTCLNGYSHDATRESLAESILNVQNAGIAVWASSGATYASGQIAMSQQVMSEVFSTNKRIGDIVREAKLMSPSLAAKQTWQLYGDPTMHIE